MPKSGARWRDRPPGFGPYTTVYNRFNRWSRQGFWLQSFEALTGHTWAVWRRLLPLLADAGFAIVAPDLHGLGHPAGAADGYTKANAAEDVQQVVRPLGSMAVNLLGTDTGTMVGYAYLS